MMDKNKRIKKALQKGDPIRAYWYEAEHKLRVAFRIQRILLKYHRGWRIRNS